MIAIAIGIPSTLAVVLAFVGWRDWLRFKAPLAPTEDVARRLKAVEDRIGIVERYAQIDSGSRGPLGG